MLQLHDYELSQSRKEEIFEIINKIIDRLVRLIDYVSDISKIDREFFRLNMQRTYFYDYIDSEIQAY